MRPVLREAVLFDTGMSGIRAAHIMNMRRTETKLGASTWIVVVMGGMLVAALFVAGKGGLLRMAIPAAAACVGLSLYLRKPTAYLYFTLWTWFITPWVRRMVDWRVGFVFQNLVLLTPFLVSAVAVLTLRERRLRANLPLAPFALCAVAVAYGFCVGIMLHPSGEVIYGLVDWLSPMVIGLHLYLRHEDFEENLAVIENSAMWGLLVMGIYGIYQFYQAPVWDAAWLLNLPGGIQSSTFGRPGPQEIRVWSTGNAPGQFASVVVTLFFFLSSKRSILKVPAYITGFYVLLLTLVRTAWVTSVVGMLYLVKSRNRKFAPTLLLIICAVAVVLLANSFFTIPILQNRFKSMTDLKDDVSIKDRTALYEDLTGAVLAEPVGIGLNNQSFYHGFPLDSGILRMLLNLGWFGTLVYSIGISRLLFMLFHRIPSQNPALAGCRAVAVVLVVTLASGPTLVGAVGAMFWIAIGLGLASIKHSAAVTVRSVQRVADLRAAASVVHSPVLSSEFPR
jgi:O-Antigen ligase